MIYILLFRRSYGTNDSNRSKNAHVSKPRGSIMASRNQPFASTRSNVVTSASKRQGPGGAGSEKGAPLRAPVQVLLEERLGEKQICINLISHISTL